MDITKLLNNLKKEGQEEEEEEYIILILSIYVKSEKNAKKW